MAKRHPHALAFLICFLASVFTAGPILLHLDQFYFQFNVREAPGTDIFTTLWRMWWIQKAILSGVSPFFCPDVFYPGGLNLMFNQAIVWSDFLTFPFVGHISLVAIHNLLFFLSLVLTAWGAFLLIHYVTKNFTASVLGGFIYSFSPFHFVHIDHLTTLTYQWIPLFTLFYLKMIQVPDRKSPLLAAFFFALTFFSDLNYGPFLMVWGALLLFYFYLSEVKTIKSPPFLKRFLAFCITAIVLVGPYAFALVKAYLPEKDSGGVGIALDSTVSQSLDLFSFFIPSFMHPFFGKWVEPFYFKVATFGGKKISGFSELVGFLGWSVLYLVYRGIRFGGRKEIKLWKVSAAIFLLLCLGPALKCFGLVQIPAEFLHLDAIARYLEPGLDPHALNLMRTHAGIPLPYLLFHFIPVLKANQAPARFMVLGLLALSVLAAYGFKNLWETHPKWRRHLTGFFCLVLFFEYYSIPSSIPFVDAPVFYQTLDAADPGDFAVLDIPLLGTISKDDIRYHRRQMDPLYSMEVSLAMYYQTFHHKKILVGAPDRRPPYLMDFIRANPFLDALSRDEFERARRIYSRKEMVDHRIKYFVLHKDRLDPEELKQATLMTTERPFFEDSRTRVFKLY
jgi:hypothetical protein